MVDIESHRIVDMIPSRETDDVKAWLGGYPNVTIVARDGSLAYRNAVEEALPGAAQVGDRFHLLKNLTDYSKEHLKNKLGKTIKVVSASAQSQGAPSSAKADGCRKLTRGGKHGRAKALIGQGFGKAAICKELSMSSKTYDKLAATERGVPENESTPMNARKHEDTVKRKQTLVDEVRELKGHGFNDSEISKRTGLDRRTVSKYTKPSFNPAHASYGVKRAGALTAYADEIDNMLSCGFKGTAIISALSDRGYHGSPSNIRAYIADWKHNRKHEYDRSLPEAAVYEVVERKNLFKLLYHPLETVKEISESQFEEVASKYPVFKTIHGIVWEFKELLKSKDARGLAPWLEKAGNLNITEISSFVAGVNKDREAVANAVALPYSNGLAEGSVNKIKVVKRVMYGRCGFQLLKNKILQLELAKSIN
jgi:hypothetical protein